MRTIDIKDKIPELIAEPPPWESFVRLGDLLKLRDLPDGGFAHANYESGLLLYALVQHYRPQRILEIGTGRGYGAFCMAQALHDAGISGQIITLDIKHYTEPQPWALDDSSGPSLAPRSLKEVWEQYMPAELRAMIEHRQGSSVESMARLLAAGDFQPDFIYVDGDHTHRGTQHDVLASMLLAARPFRMLLDDYHLRSDWLYGVRKLIDETLAPVFQLEAVFGDRRWHGEAFQDVPLADAPYAQVILDSEKTHRPLDEVFSRAQLERLLARQKRLWPLASLLEMLNYSYRKRFRSVER